jgi:hypothetical protein
LRQNLPIVLEEKVIYLATKIGVIAPVTDRCGLGQAQQEVGQVIAAARDGVSTGVESAGRESAEDKGATAVGIASVVELDSPVFHSAAKGVLTFDVSEVIAKMAGLVPA